MNKIRSYANISKELKRIYSTYASLAKSFFKMKYAYKTSLLLLYKAILNL